ncbi:hypothetical protein WAF17_19920 [Bernardetia sp. ABR2-2B]|uniref:hypothetical protein n=1 Tax=Bernardetia sp. ABR2-2B TaxID=3127472 RepID=UPI0030D564B0
MTNSITILSNSPILQENRQDPITGDLIKEGNKVVICASCKSAFLEGSWKYLGEKHCNQIETLSQVPARQSFKFVKKLKKLEQVIFSAESYGGNTTLIVAVPTGIISFILSILLVLNVINIVWLWGVVAGLISIPFIFNAFQTKEVEVKETAIYVKKGFGRKKRYPISQLDKIDFTFFNGFDHEINHDRSRIKNSLIGNEITISTPPTIRLGGVWFPLHLRLSEYDFNKNREKFIEFFSKISNILPVNLSTDDDELIKEFEVKVPKATIRKDLEGLRYFYGNFYKGEIYLG